MSRLIYTWLAVCNLFTGLDCHLLVTIFITKIVAIYDSRCFKELCTYTRIFLSCSLGHIVFRNAKDVLSVCHPECDGFREYGPLPC